MQISLNIKIKYIFFKSSQTYPFNRGRGVRLVSGGVNLSHAFVAGGGVYRLNTHTPVIA